jgi:excisionase family DNA binding protein
MAISQPAETTPEPSPGPNRQQKRHPEQARAFVGIPEAAVYLDADHKTVRRLISRGKLRAYRLGTRDIKIRVTDLESVLTPIGGAV